MIPKDLSAAGMGMGVKKKPVTGTGLNELSGFRVNADLFAIPVFSFEFYNTIDLCEN